MSSKHPFGEPVKLLGPPGPMTEEQRERMRGIIERLRERNDHARACEQDVVRVVVAKLRAKAEEWLRRASRRDDPMAVQFAEELGELADELERG